MRRFYWIMIWMASCQSSWASVEGTQVIYGSVDTVHVEDTLQITTHTSNTILQHETFDIQPHQTVEFIQPDQNSRVLNRITSTYPSRIEGSLISNGSVYLVNPAGVFFGKEAHIDVVSLVAAAAQITDNNFIREHLLFENLSGKILNEANIQVGGVTFVGRWIENAGNLCTKEEAILIASEKGVLVGKRLGRVFFELQDSVLDHPVSAGDLVGASLFQKKNSSIESKNIEIYGDEVKLEGTLTIGEHGSSGSVVVNGKKIGLYGTHIDLTHSHDAGFAMIGSEDLTEFVYGDHASRIEAHSHATGGGGQIHLLSKGQVSFHGVLLMHGSEEKEGGLLKVRGSQIIREGGFVFPAFEELRRGGTFSQNFDGHITSANVDSLINNKTVDVDLEADQILIDADVIAIVPEGKRLTLTAGNALITHNGTIKTRGTSQSFVNLVSEPNTSLLAKIDMPAGQSQGTPAIMLNDASELTLVGNITVGEGRDLVGGSKWIMNSGRGGQVGTDAFVCNAKINAPNAELFIVGGDIEFNNDTVAKSLSTIDPENPTTESAPNLVINPTKVGGTGASFTLSGELDITATQKAELIGPIHVGSLDMQNPAPLIIGGQITVDGDATFDTTDETITGNSPTITVGNTLTWKPGTIVLNNGWTINSPNAEFVLEALTAEGPLVINAANVEIDTFTMIGDSTITASDSLLGLGSFQGSGTQIWETGGNFGDGDGNTLFTNDGDLFITAGQSSGDLMVINAGISGTGQRVLIGGDIELGPLLGGDSWDIQGEKITVKDVINGGGNWNVQSRGEIAFLSTINGGDSWDIQGQKVTFTDTINGGLDWVVTAAEDIFTNTIGEVTPPRSMIFNANRLFAAGDMTVGGNTLIFNTDFILTTDVTLTDTGGGIFFSENIYANTPDVWTLTLDALQDISVTGRVSLDLFSRVKELRVKQVSDFSLQGPVLLQQGLIQEQGTGTTTFASVIDLSGQPTLIPTLEGGTVSVTTAGTISALGGVTTKGGDQTLLLDAGNGGNVELKSLTGEILVGAITTNGGAGSGTGGNAGSISLFDNTEMMITKQLTYQPKGRIGLFGPLSAQSGFGTTGVAGAITLSGSRSQVPDRATIYSPRGTDIKIAGGNVSLAKNSVITSLGDLTIDSVGEVTLSDQVALGDITITANKIILLTHPIGRILLSNGQAVTGPPLHSTAGGVVTTNLPPITIVPNPVVFIGGETQEIITNSFMLQGSQREFFATLLTLDGFALNINPFRIENITIDISPLVQDPYTFLETHQKIEKWAKEAGYSLDVLAILIDEKIRQQVPRSWQLWQKIKLDVLSRKNPLERALALYYKKLKVGIFSPTRFVSGLSFSKPGRQGLLFLKALVDFETKLQHEHGKEAEELIEMLSIFARPKRLSEGNWQLVQKVIQTHVQPKTL